MRKYTKYAACRVTAEEHFLDTAAVDKWGCRRSPWTGRADVALTVRLSRAFGVRGLRK